MNKQDIKCEWFGPRIIDPHELFHLAKWKRSVIGSGRCLYGYGMKPKPAQVIVNMNFATVMKQIDDGLYVYIPQGRSPRKKPERWANLCGIEILDPDGWREPYNRIHGHKEWTDRITFHEFYLRSVISTIQLVDNDRFLKYRNAKSWKDMI